MKNNNVLTYVLFGLLGMFIIAAGYYACEKQKREKELKAREEAELQETLRDMGYAEDSDTTGSTYTNTDTTTKSTGVKPISGNVKTGGKGTVSKDGVEDYSAAPVTPNKQSSTKTVAPVSPKSTATTTKGVTAVKGPGSGRWEVRAGTFEYKDGARRRLEEVIKAGYPNAEITKTKSGKAAVVVFRSNDKAAAIRVADKLEEKNIDAAVFVKGS